MGSLHVRLTKTTKEQEAFALLPRQSSMKLLLPLEIIALILHVLVICTSLWLLPRSAWRKLHRLIRHNPPSRLAVFRNPTPMTVHDKFCISIIATLNLFLFLMFFDDCLALYSISNNNEEGFLKQLFPSNALFSAIFRFSGILFGFGACVLLPHFTAYKFRRFFFNSTEKTKYEKWVFCFEKIVLPIAATIVALVFILTDVIPFDESFPWLRLVIVVLNTQALVMFIALLVKYKVKKKIKLFFNSHKSSIIPVGISTNETDAGLR